MEKPAEQGELSKRKQKKEAKRIKRQEAKEAFNSLDGQVQHTNDDSIVSKRSAVVHGYIDDTFLRHFVKSKSDRSPLINRGYYLRMKVIESFLTESIKKVFDLYRKDTGVQVVSLGAGYDTMGMRYLLTHPDKTYFIKNVQFFDVDFPAVMQAKSSLMKAAPEGTFPSDWKLDPSSQTVFIQSPSYCAVGVDLREAEKELLPSLQAAQSSFDPNKPTIFYAECVMQYMPPAGSVSLLKHLASSFTKSLFFAYDQLHPDDSFGKVMLHSLDIRKSPLLGIVSMKDGEALMQRAIRCGYKYSSFANFYDLARFFITHEEELRLRTLEPFDEHEEWSEMCEHYGITMATNLDNFPRRWHSSFKDIASLKQCTAKSLPSTPCQTQVWPSARFRCERWGFGEIDSFVAADGDRWFVSFGGFSGGKLHGRVSTVYVQTLRQGDLMVTEVNEVTPGPLIFHSFTRLSSMQYLVFGGRTNPSDVKGEAYLLSLSDIDMSTQSISIRWTLLSMTEGNSPSPRFRHTGISIGENKVFIFGGQDANGSFLGDAWIGIFHPSKSQIEWECLPLTGSPPDPCCSSAGVFYKNHVFLSGGLKKDFTASGKIVKIELGKGKCIQSRESIGERFSHSLSVVHLNQKDYFFVLGGSLTAPKDQAHAALLVNPENLALEVSVTLPNSTFWWSKHSTVTLDKGVMAVIGGGYTCFSFGTALSPPLILLLGGASFNEEAIFLQSKKNVSAELERKVCFSPPKEVDPMKLTEKTFLEVTTAASRPIVFRHADLGPCVNKWKSREYLAEAEKDMVVSTHVASGSSMLDFVAKNFVFRHMSFKDLVNQVTDATKFFRDHGRLPKDVFYFRSVSSHMKTERANVWKDFPNLGKDFVLPDFVESVIKPRMHQACLRINSCSVSVWLHYDVMDNILCQIVGVKKVTLFPPSQWNNLYMVGSSSPLLSMSNPDLERFPKFVEAQKHMIEVTLHPGDVLYVPALWFHHLETLESPDGGDDYSISINVFYEHFESKLYDSKDLYGNKDVPQYAALRSNIVSHATKLVKNQEKLKTGDAFANTKHTEFALRQAIQDLEVLANSLEAKNKIF